MKEIIVTYRPGDIVKTGSVVEKIQHVRFIGDGVDVSDGFNTFDELYDHSIALFIALCRILRKEAGHNGIWRSKLHNDGTMYDGWFVMGINEEAGKQITYHLPIDRWSETEFAAELSHAPKWDGHTAADVLGRLSQL